jgi:hypothetical protein
MATSTLLVNPGYSGLLTIDDKNIRCSDFSVTAEQQPLFYQHILGLRDSIPQGQGSKGDTGELNPQRNLWRPSVQLGRASFNYPATENITLFNAAKKGDDVSGNFVFDCTPMGYDISEAKIGSYKLSVTAGDILTVSAELVGKMLEDTATQEAIFDVTEEKFITWDKCSISMPNIPNSSIYSFELSINNNTIPIYTSGQNNTNLFPYKIRIGVQEVSGSIGFYTKGENLAWLTSSSSPVTIIFATAGFTVNIKALLHPVSRVGSVTPVISTVAFSGVGQALGAA